MRILILGAFNKEIESIIKKFNETSTIKERRVSNYNCHRFNIAGHKILMSLTTVGTAPAAVTTTLLSKKFKPDLIMMCGTAGALQAKGDIEAKALQVGDVMISKKVVYIDQYELFQKLPSMPAYAECAKDPHSGQQITHVYQSPDELVSAATSLSNIPTVSGNIGVSNFFPVPKDLLSTLHELNCKVIEMESSGVFSVAQRMGIPSLAVRVVSNLLTKEGKDLGTTKENVQLCSSRLADFMSAFLSSEALTKALDNIKAKSIVPPADEIKPITLPIQGAYHNFKKSKLKPATPISGSSKKRAQFRT